MTPGQKERIVRNVAIADMHKRGMDMAQIGDRFGLTAQRVHQVLVERGVNVRGKGPKKRTKDRLAEEVARRERKSMKLWGVGVQEVKALRGNGLLNAFMTQRSNARRRGIGWGLTLAEWHGAWQASGKLADRGLGRGKFMMARIENAKGYQVGNVQIVHAHARPDCWEKFDEKKK